MEFHAFHGCLEHETKIGNTYLVSLSMNLDTSKAGDTDQLEDTLNYQEVYDVIRREMEIPSKLIEHAGQRLIDAVFADFEQINELKLTLTKLNPPLGAKVESVSIEISKQRKNE